MNKYVLNFFLFINCLYEKYKFNKYYLYNNLTNEYQDTSLIIYILNIPFIGSYIVNEVMNSLGNTLIIDNGRNIANFKEIQPSTITKKILKKLVYKDNKCEIECENFKKCVSKINNDVNLGFLISFYNEIKLNEDSILEIEYFFGSNKVIKLKKEMQLKELYL